METGNEGKMETHTHRISITRCDPLPAPCRFDDQLTTIT
jgi:hypothetical protein